MAFDNDQKSIGRSAAWAIVGTSACFIAAGQSTLLEADALHDRLALLTISFAPLAISIFLDIARLAHHRFSDPTDRHAAAAYTQTARAGLLSAILRNTQEQVTFAALVYAIATIALPKGWTDSIIGCSTLFIIGRLCFAMRYANGAGGRAFGFGLTFYPSVALALLTGVTVIF